MASDLFDHDVDLISVLHVEVLWSLTLVQTFSVEQEADIGSIELNKTKFTL